MKPESPYRVGLFRPVSKAAIDLLTQLKSFVWVYSFGFVANLAPYGLLFWILWGDISVMFGLLGFGLFLGAMAGVGQMFVVHLSDPRFVRTLDDCGSADGGSTELANLCIGSDLAKPIGLVLWLATKDFSESQPGRLNRAFAGAVWASLVVSALVAFTYSTMPPGIDTLPVWQSIAALGGLGAAIGGVAGALTDSV